jgi:hypothetical protein
VSRDIEPIARIRLARSLPRMLAWPAVLLLLAAGLVASASLRGTSASPALLAAAASAVVVAVAWSAWLFSIRLEVEESEIRVSWIGGERRYTLVPGPVTRVRFRGENSSRLRVRTGFLGYGLGPARLREEEQIHVVRLAPAPTAILVPTDRGRLAIVAARDDELLDALSRAARARQRLDDLARAPAPPSVAPPGLSEVAEVEAPSDEPPAMVEAIDQPEVRPMTGIERALYESRLADERAALDAASATALEAERLDEKRSAAVAGAEPEASDAQVPEAVGAIAAMRAIEVDEPAAAQEERPRRIGTGRLDPSRAIVVVPILASLVVWGVGAASGRAPDPATDVGRLTAIALVMAGPASAVGAMVARVAWPRLVGVVVAGGIAASVLIGRSLLGG